MISPRKLYSMIAAESNYCPFDQISDAFKEMIVPAEDPSFYEHTGFDYAAIKRCIKHNIKNLRWAFGGSTISQQLAKNLYCSFEKNLWRKIKEAYLTVLIERQLTKQQILELYINIIYYGNGQYGIRDAAKYYFSIEPSELTQLQSVTLVTIIPGPTRFNPLTHPDYFVERREEVLWAFEEIHQIIDADFVKDVRENYDAQNLGKLFHLSGEPLLDSTVPMENAMIKKLIP